MHAIAVLQIAKYAQAPTQKTKKASMSSDILASRRL